MRSSPFRLLSPWLSLSGNGKDCYAGYPGLDARLSVVKTISHEVDTRVHSSETKGHQYDNSKFSSHKANHVLHLWTCLAMVILLERILTSLIIEHTLHGEKKSKMVNGAVFSSAFRVAVEFIGAFL